MSFEKISPLEKTDSAEKIEDTIRDKISALPVGTAEWPTKLVEDLEEKFEDKLADLTNMDLPPQEKIPRLEKVEAELDLFIKKRKNLFLKNFEVKSSVREFFEKHVPAEALEANKQKIMRLLKEVFNREENFLGKGRVATVHKGSNYPEYCFKLIKDFALYAEGVNVEKEADFLDALADLKVNRVRTPKPFYSVMENKKHFLVMETLPGENLAEIMERNLPLAEDFDFASLFSNLREFVKEMNGRGIHHGDLHLGNIMLDRNSSQAYVIDFGSARYEFGDTEIKENSSGGNKTLFYKKDEEKLKESESTFKRWLMKNKKLTEEQL